MKESIINFAKSILPPKCVSFIRTLVRNFHPIGVLRGNHYRNKLASRSDKKEKLRIGFLVYEPKSWNSLRPLYAESLLHPDVVPFLIVLPDPDSGIANMDYFRTMDTKAINAFQNNKWLDLKSLFLDIVFRQSPYDLVYPKPYRSKHMAKYTRVCYIPYGYNPSPEKHLSIEYNVNFLLNAYALFVDSTTAEQFCIKRVNDMFFHPNIKIFNIGFPRFDLCRGNTKLSLGYTFLWIPRWSIDNISNDATNFFNYKDKLLKFFKNNPNINLIIRPHPLMFGNFIKRGVMTQEEVDSFLDMIDKTTNIKFDKNFDYLDTFDEANALIADFSSLTIEFFLTGKPIIYCGAKSEFNSETLEMLRCFYPGGNWELIENYLRLLSNNIDSVRNERYRVIESFKRYNGNNASKKILLQCFEL